MKIHRHDYEGHNARDRDEADARIDRFCKWFLLAGAPLMLVAMIAFSVWVSVSACHEGFRAGGCNDAVSMTIMIAVFAIPSGLMSVRLALRPQPDRT